MEMPRAQWYDKAVRPMCNLKEGTRMSLQDLFENPPPEFRQAPFWFWNHRLDKELLSWQIQQMHEKGLGGFVMHARHGLITPYLSDEWMDCIRHGCTEAKRHGMIAWAYDERDWPSGPAGGTVIQDPANRMSYLRLEEELVEGPQEVEFGIKIIAAYRLSDAGKMARVREKRVRFGKGRHRLLKAVRSECPAILWFDSYLDTLNPEACGAFIRSTYDFHEQKLGDLRTLGLAGFFTDEPALSTYPDDLRRIPWTPELPGAFKKTKGYDLLDHLPDLFSPGEAGAQVRYDYWDVVTDLFEQAFFVQISGWCEKRGLKLIGHPLGEEPLFYQFRCLGTIFKHLKHLHMPGMDHLTITIGKHHPMSMTPKLVASAALLAGRERTMTETFGESGWGLTLREMKWMCDWQMVNGINYFIPHAFYYSVAGRRKKDSPPSEFYQTPHWEHYRLLAEYTARITAMMTGGEHVAKVAVLYPMSSVWADFVPGDAVPDSVLHMEAAFAPLGETLLSLHRDFVIVDEASLAHAELGEGFFTVKNLRFEALVLPAMTSIRYDVFAVMKRIAEHATVVSVGTDRLRLLTSTVSATVDLREVHGVTVLETLDPDALADSLSGVTPDVAMAHAPEVYYLHRRHHGQDFFFFANTGREAVDTEVSFECVGAVTVWDPETGISGPAPDNMVEEGRLVMSLRLAPLGSMLLSIDPSRPPIDFHVVPFHPEQRIEVCKDLWHFTPFNGNFLALKNWRMNLEMRHKVTELRYTTEFILSERIANLRLILDGVPEHPYGVPEAARPLVAPEVCSEVMLDGEALSVELPWEIDPHFRVLGLGDRVEPGLHRLEIILRNQGWFPQPGLEEYAWLAGDFMLELDGAAPRLSPCRGVRAGAWEKQGFPFFSGTAAYAADVLLPNDLVGKRVFLDAGHVGHLLEVEINGKTAAVRAWPPYRAEITHCVWPGLSNLIILKVTNSARNFFEGPDKEHPSGLLDPVWLEIG